MDFNWITAYRWRRFVLESIIALSLASLIWLYMHSRAQQTLEHVQIPVQIQLAPQQREQYALELPSAPRVAVSFTGHATRVRDIRKKLQRGQLVVSIVYTVPEAYSNESTFCDQLSIESSHLPITPGVNVELVETGSSVPITVHRLVERTVPVRLDYSGDARVSQIKLEPSTVLVRGPKAALERVDVLSTVPYVLTAPADETTEPFVKDQVSMVAEVDGRAIQVTPRHVQFRCKVQPKRRIYEIKDVPVQFLCPEQFPYRARFVDEKAGKIAVRILGPAGDEPPPVLAFVDLTTGSYGRGRNLQPLRLQLPKDFQLAENQTPMIAFQLEEAVEPMPPAQLLPEPD